MPIGGTVVGLVRWLPFHDDLILPVAIHVSYGAVVWRVTVGLVGQVVYAISGSVELKDAIDITLWRGCCGCFDYLPVSSGHHAVFAGACAIGVGIVGLVLQVGCDGYSIAQQVERCCRCGVGA